MGANLRQVVLGYIRECQKNGVSAGDPKWLDMLMSVAIDDMSDGYAALHAPVAPWRAETRVILPGGEANGTQRVDLPFPWPVVVVGLRPVVRPIRPIATGLVIPDVDDIEVQMDVNLTTQLNTAQGVTGAVNQQGNNYVTLGSIGVQEPVLLGMALKDPKPSLGFTYRWSQNPPTPPTSPFFTDTLIKVTAYYFPMYPQESSNVAPSLRNAP